MLLSHLSWVTLNSCLILSLQSLSLFPHICISHTQTRTLKHTQTRTLKHTHTRHAHADAHTTHSFPVSLSYRYTGNMSMCKSNCTHTLYFLSLILVFFFSSFPFLSQATLKTKQMINTRTEHGINTKCCAEQIDCFSHEGDLKCSGAKQKNAEQQAPTIAPNTTGLTIYLTLLCSFTLSSSLAWFVSSPVLSALDSLSSRSSLRFSCPFLSFPPKR